MENQNLVSDVMTALHTLDPDVTRRNTYMNTRDRYLYQSGLYEDLDIEGWFADYNYLTRVVDIHTAQLMGRPFSIYSYYDKEDVSVYADDPDQEKLAILRNKKAKANADARKKAVDAIIRDNGGDQLYKDGARLGSAYGMTAYKQWYDKDAKQVKQVLIESPQNLYIAWSDNNFREFDWIAYVDQISADQAYRKWGDKLPEGAVFDTSKNGDALAIGNGNTADPLSQLTNHNDGIVTQTDREMVTVIDLTGFLKGWKADDKGGATRADRGKETRSSYLLVGGHLVQTISTEKYMPKYYVIDNRRNPRRAWGASDLPDAALDINKELVQLEADERRFIEKNLYGLIQAKGFTAESIPRKKPRKQQVVAMGVEQSLQEMPISFQSIGEVRATKASKLEAFVRVAGVGRVLFDDPSVNANSNQALMTTMKPVIDIVEDKQSRWTPVLQEMFTDALNLAAQFIPSLKEAVEDDNNWYLCVEWASVLRKEDSAYQAMWLNRFNANTVSLETYLEKMGDNDTTEEVDRLKDELKDPVTAAILGKMVGEVAHQAINKSLGIPPWGYVVPKVALRGDLTPQQEANMAQNYGWQEGPYGGSIGPQGQQGQAANDNFINSGQIIDPTTGQPGNAYDGGVPTHALPNPGAGAPQGNAAPGQIGTPDQNHMSPVSAPGTGRPQLSPEGAVAQTSQNHGA